MSHKQRLCFEAMILPSPDVGMAGWLLERNCLDNTLCSVVCSDSLIVVCIQMVLGISHFLKVSKELSMQYCSPIFPSSSQH